MKRAYKEHTIQAIAVTSACLKMGARRPVEAPPSQSMRGKLEAEWFPKDVLRNK